MVFSPGRPRGFEELDDRSGDRARIEHGRMAERGGLAIEPSFAGDLVGIMGKHHVVGGRNEGEAGAGK
jgi:hypothetical protein